MRRGARLARQGQAPVQLRPAAHRVATWLRGRCSRRWLWLGLGVLVVLACDSRRPLESRGAPPASLGWSRPAPESVTPAADAGVPARRARRAGADRAAAEEPSEIGAALDAADVAGSVSDPFIIDGLVDVAPAGPISATERGIAMFDKENRLLLAAFDGQLEPGAAPRETHVTPLPDAAGPFPLARGPAVRRGLAYWVSRGRLLGQSLNSAGSASALVLTEDARIGTRAAVPVGSARHLQGLPQIAAYIARPKEPEGPPTAQLWIEGQHTGLRLTDDASSSHSVALVATAQGLSVVFLEARTGMSTIHSRLITFSRTAQTHAPSLGEDHIVWVGGPAQPTTELFALPSEPDVRAYLTLERDVTHFGLAGLDVSLRPGAEYPVNPDWLLYDNGIQPAPFALATVCGRSVVLLARPSSAQPRAPQELVLLELDAGAHARAAVIARSRAFFDVSLIGLNGGALLAYVADHRTWSRTIRCLRR
jgi:hypothetical protein